MADNKIKCPICFIDFLEKGISYRLTETIETNGFIRYNEKGKKIANGSAIMTYENGKDKYFAPKKTYFFEPFCPNCYTMLDITKDEAFGELDPPIYAMRVNGNGNGNGEEDEKGT